MREKLYVNDPDIPYTTTKVDPLRTKSEIDGILARWGIKRTAWVWDPDNNQIQLHFELPYEKFGNADMPLVVRLEPPRIWNKRTRKHEESINWRVSMRILHWFIKDSLAMAYAMQSQKAVAFLPYIAADDGHVLKDIVLPQISLLKSLPERPSAAILDAERF